MRSKASFVKALGCFLKCHFSEVEEMYLMDEHTVAVRYVNGYEKRINIAADSKAALVADVVRQGLMS